MAQSKSAFRRLPSTLKSLRIAVTNRQRRWRVNRRRLAKAVCAVLRSEGFRKATISLAVVDDAAIHSINNRYLQHDEPTDVISFLFEHRKSFIDGEIVVSADTAATAAEQFGSTPADELLLYVVHGTLHLIGYDDLTAKDRKQMRQREQFHMSLLQMPAQFNGASVARSSTRKTKVTSKPKRISRKMTRE